MEQGAGLRVKFDPRGRTYTAKDFRGMSDYDLLCKVIVFAVYLPWKDQANRDDLATMLLIASRSIKERDKAGTPRGKEGGMSKQNAQVKVRGRDAKDSYFSCGVSYPLPNTGNPAILPYRQAHIALRVIGEAIRNMKAGKKRKEQLGGAVLELMVAFENANLKIGGEGLPLELSRIWPGWNDDGTRKDENAPDQESGKTQDQGQQTSEGEPSHKHHHTEKRAA
jgi:hypothetical protein